MKKCSKLLIAAGLAFTVAFSSIVSFVSIKKEVIETEAYTNGDAATYYSNIGNKTGSELLSALQGLNSTKLQHRVGYNSMPSYFPTTDPGSSSGQTTSFYNIGSFSSRKEPLYHIGLIYSVAAYEHDIVFIDAFEV